MGTGPAMILTAVQIGFDSRADNQIGEHLGGRHG